MPEDLARLTVALTFDHDAISDSVRRGDSPVKLSHGEFGPRVGAPRLLSLLARNGIPSTWFVPGHTLVTFPDSIRAILDGAHELGTHGWYHEDLAELSRDEQRDIVERSRDAIGELTGSAPQGFRAPYWSLGVDTLALVEAAGYRYDSSLMADDVSPYRVRVDDRHSVADGTRWGHESSLLEVPISWALDDWPHFEPAPERGRDGLSAPSKVLEIWTGELRWAWEHEPGGLLTLTMHPECMGRGHRVQMLEAFIAEAKSLEGVVFDRLDRYLDRWQASRPAPSEASPV
jgi:peptidoglycan-N-acetylglucosamine deacetylase